MGNTDWVRDFFGRIDAMDLDGLLSYLTDDARLRFANAEVVSGKEAIRETFTEFFASVKGMRHDIAQVWVLPDAAICHGIVTFFPHDGESVAFPFADIFNTEGERIRDYLIFVDMAPLDAMGS